MQFQLPNGQMFDTENPACPTCGSEMYDNRESKRRPNLPDFKCKDKNCIDTKGYNTGVYLPKGTAPKLVPAAKPIPAPIQAQKPLVQTPVTPKPYNKSDYGNSVPPSMYGAWAMNLVVSLVGQGKVTSVAEGIQAYKEALKGVGDTIEGNKVVLDAKSPVPVAQQEKQVAKPTPAPVQAPITPATMDSPGLSEVDPLQAIENELGTASGEISAEDLSQLDL